MEFLSPVFDKAWDLLVQPVSRQLGYLYNYESNVEELKEWYVDLNSDMLNLSHQVEEEERNAQDVEDRVTTWLKDAISHLTKVDNFLKDERHLETGYSRGFLNLKLRYRLGRKAKKMSSKCHKLQGKREKFSPISRRPKSEATEAALNDSVYEPFKSREAIMEKVVNSLGDPTTKMIGIDGQGGVGKTTLVNVGK